jgi:hypothetical protein
MPKSLTDEQKAAALEKRKQYLREYMKEHMKNIYGDDKREYNRLAAQRRRDKLKNVIIDNLGLKVS